MNIFFKMKSESATFANCEAICANIGLAALKYMGFVDH